MREVDALIIGGGSAGMAAAVALREEGIQNLLILERDRELGGILLQCIHNGFGLHYFKEELTGPSYAERWVRKVEELGIPYETESMVLSLTRDKEVLVASPKRGYEKIRAGCIVLAMGCRERTRGAIQIPGFRPAGIWTAGTAQRYLNMEGLLVGKRVFILGSGDIGLIMARRMTLEGAKVLGVAEILPYSNGLPRNIQQCLRDFDIPLYLRHTVTDVRGRDRLEGITISEVNPALEPLPGTEKHFDCDTLLLSVGLIPENALTEEAGIPLSRKTRGAIVDEGCETEADGIFACGNVLHVHDLVDYVSEEGRRAGLSAAGYLKGKRKEKVFLGISPGEGVSYVLPQRVHKEENASWKLFFRVKKELRNVRILLEAGGTVLASRKANHMVPAEMESLVVKGVSLPEDASELLLRIQEVDA